MAEVHTCEGMHLQTLKNKNFHIYPYVFCTLNLLVFFFLHQLPKTQTTPTSLIYTFQLLSLNYPLNLENHSSSTSTTLIHSAGSTTTKPRRATTPNPFHLHSRAVAEPRLALCGLVPPLILKVSSYITYVYTH